jgi:hypothetical protein
MIQRCQSMEGLPFLAGGGVNGRMKFTENLLTNIQLSKLLHLEIPNITKAVTKHLPVSKTCQHAPTLNPHVRLVNALNITLINIIFTL